MTHRYRDVLGPVRPLKNANWCRRREPKADTAAHLVDRVLPEAPVREWVLTVPYALRHRLARHSGKYEVWLPT